jgi:hypothetical protein
MVPHLDATKPDRAPENPDARLSGPPIRDCDTADPIGNIPGKTTA